MFSFTDHKDLNLHKEWNHHISTAAQNIHLHYNSTEGFLVILYTGTQITLSFLVKLWPVSTSVWHDLEQIAVPVLFTWPFPCGYQGFTPAQCGQWEVSYLLLCESHCKRRGRCFTAVCLCLVCVRVCDAGPRILATPCWRRERAVAVIPAGGEQRWVEWRLGNWL